ncbi:MAG TPA: ChaN family lipoprotein [Kofleriaceae bacterium]|nr:ChaN family lipoprotein [Kofleriaceae bacterium]
MERPVLACALALSLMAGSAACGGASTPGATSPGEVRGVEAAALPYRVLRARGGQEIAREDLLRELAAADAVCIGEHHPNPHDHWVQLTLVRELAARARADRRTLALGMEMFQRPFQGVLDDFSAGRIDEQALLGRSGWKDRWGYDWSLYRPIVLGARDQGAALLALNTERELTKKVSRKGIDSLTPADREAMPELVLDDPDHRAWWDEIMGSMGGAHGHGREEDGENGEEGGEHGEEGGEHGEKHGEHGEKSAAPAPDPEAAAQSERIYAAQVLWDETMADTAHRWLAAGPGRQVVILAGNGHCHESAIVRRLERRGVGNAVSIRPIIDDGEGNVAALLADPENDYLFVMTAQ